MTATFVPAPPVNIPLVGKDGLITRPWYAHFTARHEQLGGSIDKVEASHAAAMAAVPKTTNVVGSGGLHAVQASLQNDVGVALYKIVTTVANLPTAGNATGDWAYAVNGRKTGEGAGAGTGVPCFWSAGIWVAVATNGAAAA